MNIFINHKILTVTERNRLAAVKNETDYQYVSGEVDDTEIISQTSGSGAEFVITGELDYDGISWRFRIYAIDLDKRNRVASTALYINEDDRQLAYYFDAQPDDDVIPTKPDRKTDLSWQLGIVLGGGILHQETAATRYGSEVENAKYKEIRDLDLLFLGGTAQFNIGNYLSFEVDFGYAPSLIDSGGNFKNMKGLPVCPLFVEFSLPLGPMEIDIGGGYTIGLGISGEASVGIKLGRGVLFGEFIYVSGLGSVWGMTRWSNIMGFMGGYKFNL
jgi:hypothetical protein